MNTCMYDNDKQYNINYKNIFLTVSLYCQILRAYIMYYIMYYEK
jgi:hypothetical protein